MSKSIILIKNPHGFSFATDADRESASSWKMGKPLKCEITEWSRRSLAMHGMYWGGLLALTIDYWTPTVDLTTDAEKKLIHQFCKVLDDNGGGGEVATWGDMFLSKLSDKRQEHIEVPTKSIESLHEFIKEQAGLYDVIITPIGIKKKIKSINFNAMTQEQFNDFYKKAFNICWTLILSKSFDNEAQCQHVIDQLLRMGG